MPFLTIDRIQVFYESHGQGVPLVLVHGLGSSGRDWNFQVEAFADQYQVITYDSRGHGRSHKPAPPYSVPMFANDLESLLNALGLEKVHLVGVSMGGWTSFEFAVHHSDRLHSLTIINSGPELVVRTWAERRELWKRLILFRLFSMEKIGKSLAPRLFPKPEHAEFKQTFIERWAENDKRAYMASLQGAVGWTVLDELENITCPVLVIAADEDFYSSVESKQAYVDLIPDAKLEVMFDCRHAAPVEKSQELNELLKNFLKDVAANPH